jgi:hypothetical protein
VELPGVLPEIAALPAAMNIVAVVPAWNEAATVAATVGPLLAAGCFSRVLVVDDGSTDATAEVARAAGAEVLSLRPNRGKGGAMREAVEGILRDGGDGTVGAVGFFDADLKGFSPEHARALAASVAEGRAAMVCGLRDYGPARNSIQRTLPPITGERVVRAEVLRALPAHFWSGYRIEMGLNAAALAMPRLGPVLLVDLPGLGIVNKTEKFGVAEGMVRHARMTREVLCAMRDAWGYFGLAVPPGHALAATLGGLPEGPTDVGVPTVVSAVVPTVAHTVPVGPRALAPRRPVQRTIPYGSTASTRGAS